MIKLLLVTHYYPAHLGGVEIVAFNIAKKLSETRKVNIIWCAADCDNAPDNFENFFTEPLKSYNFIEKILPFPYPLPGISGCIKLWKNIKKCDVLYIHDFLYASNLLAFIFAKIKKKKIILTQHIGFIPYKSSFLRTILSLINKTIGKYILTHTYASVFISNGVTEYFGNITGKSDNFHFIPNGTDNSIYKVYTAHERTGIRKKYNFRRFTFLFVGRFTEKKGLPIIRIAAEKLSGCDFVFAGWGLINPDDWKLDNVRVVKGLQGKEIAELYNACDMLILPSYGEGFPLVVQEALACGLYIIVSEEIVKAYPEIENLTSQIYFENQSPDLLIDRISEFIDNYSYSLDSRITKSEFAQNHWDWNQNCKEYLHLLEN